MTWDWRSDPVVEDSGPTWDWQNDPVVDSAVSTADLDSARSNAVRSVNSAFGVGPPPVAKPEPQRKLSDLRDFDHERAEKLLARPRNAADIGKLRKGTPYIAPDSSLKVAGGGAATLEQILAPLDLDTTRERMGAVAYPQSYAGLMGGGAGVIAPVLRAVGADYDAAKFQSYGGALQQHAQRIAEETGENPIGATALRGVAASLPAAFAAGRLAGPYGAIGAGSVQEADSSYHEARMLGKPKEEAAQYAKNQGVIEFAIAGVMQRLGLGGLESTFGQAATTGIKQALKRTGQELAEENLTELAHAIESRLSGINPEALTPENLFQVVQDTTAQTLATMGIAEGVNARRGQPQVQPEEAAEPEPVAVPEAAPVELPRDPRWKYTKDGAAPADPRLADTTAAAFPESTPEDSADASTLEAFPDGPDLPKGLDAAPPEIQKSLRSLPDWILGNLKGTQIAKARFGGGHEGEGTRYDQTQNAVLYEEGDLDADAVDHAAHEATVAYLDKNDADIRPFVSEWAEMRYTHVPGVAERTKKEGVLSGPYVADTLASELRRRLSGQSVSFSPNDQTAEQRNALLDKFIAGKGKYQSTTKLPSRRDELQALSVGQLNEIASDLGLGKSLSKGKLIQSILQAEHTQPAKEVILEEEAKEGRQGGGLLEPVPTAPSAVPSTGNAATDFERDNPHLNQPKYEDRPAEVEWDDDVRLDTLAPSPPSQPPAAGPALTIPANPLRIVGAANIPGSKMLGGIGAALKKWMTSAGNLPQQAYDLAQKKDASIAREAKQLEFELTGLKDAVAQDGGTKLSPIGADLINRAMQGDAQAISQLPAKVREKVQAIRNHIDTLSRRLIDNGLAQGKLEVTIEENMGSYVTRSYEVFDNPNWKGKVPQEVRNKAHALLKQDNPGKSDQEIANMIDDMLTKEKATALIAGRRLGGKDLSITKARKDIAPEIRALLGEYKDPYVNAARAITKMAHLASNHEFLTSVREAGMGKFFFEKDNPEQPRPAGFNAQMAADASDVMSPLNGLMTTPEVKEAFDSVYGPKGVGGDLWDHFFKWYMKAVVLTKFSKTVLSPQATIRNFTGNPLFAIQNGHWRLGELGTGLTTAGESVRTSLPQFVRSLLSNNTAAKVRFLRYAELGLTHGDTYSGELRAALSEAINDVPAEVESNPFYQLTKQGVGALSETYQAADTVWKIYAFENEKARYTNAYKAAGVNKTEAEIEQEAADIVRNTYPTYDKIPAAIRSIRRTPVVGAFVSFPAEVIRTTYHSFKQTAKELNDPALRGIGAQRLAGNLAALSLPAALAAALRYISGITGEDDEDMREFLPPWSKNSDIAWLYKGEDDKPGYIDMSYTLPSSVWRKPLNAMLSGDDWESKFQDAAWEFAQPYFGEELLFQRVVDMLRNKTANGGQVYNPTASDTKKLADITLHIAEAAEPGFWTSAERINKAAKGTIEPSGRAYNMTHELAAVGTGLRIQETDIPTSLGFAASDYSNKLADATKIFSSKYGSRGTVEEGEVSQAYKESDASRRKLFEEMSRKVRAAINLGVPEREVVRTMRASGVSLEGVQSIMAGKYTPYVPSPEIEKRAAKSTAYQKRRQELLSARP